MPALKIDSFGGMLPAVDDRLLPDHAAAHSENTWLYTGKIQGIPEATFVRACTQGTGKVFRLPNSFVDSDHLDDSVWLEVGDPDTDILRAPVLGDSFDRYYWAAASHAPKYNTRARIAAGSAEFLLGVPVPGTPTLAHSGGTGAVESRAYLTTWVTAYGEEGPPSTPVLATGKIDDTWTLTIPAASPSDLGTSRNLTHTNIYRTVTAVGGTTTFFFVAQIPIGTLTYADTIADSVVTLNDELQSTNWTGPPSDLAGFISMPNGIIAGFRANEIWFCEPYRPHAWPVAYTIVVDYPVIGLGVTNQTLIVCTEAYPIMVSGIDPSTMAQSKSASLEPCISRGSILSTTEGVYYASPNGLVFVANGGVANLTRTLLTKDKWKNLTNMPTLRAGRLGTAYYAFGSARPGMFDSGGFDTSSFSQQDFTGAYVGILIDPADNSIGRSYAAVASEAAGRVAVNLMSDTIPVTNVINDAWSGELFIIRDDSLYRLDLSQASPTRRPYIWRSKVVQVPRPDNFGALIIFWNPPDTDPAATGTAPIIVSEAEFPALPAGSPLGVARVYADGELVWTRNLVKSGELMRLPSGFKANYWQVEIESYVDIYSLQFGTSVKALAQV